MKSQQSDKNLSKQVRVDAGLHYLLKIKATEQKTTIKTLLEGYLAELLSVANKK